MALTVTTEQSQEILAEYEAAHPCQKSIDGLETIYQVPPTIGTGFVREIELYPGLELLIFNETYENLTFKYQAHPHPVQFMIHLAGVINSGDFLYQDPQQSYIGGSGIQPAIADFYPGKQTLIGVDINCDPILFQQFFGQPSGEIPVELLPLFQGESRQQVFSPKVSAQVRSIVRQIIDCPLTGILKKTYWQAKVMELMSVQLHDVFLSSQPPKHSALKPNTIAQIHYAKQIIDTRLNNPPSILELTQITGVSDRTLRRGFQTLFNTTICGYLTKLRLNQAEHLLCLGELTMIEVAQAIGYSNQGHFAAAFKRQFGITPQQYAIAKRGAKVVQK